MKAAYKSALLAFGFRLNNATFTPCPLGTFKNISTKGADGCQECPPGNFQLPFLIQWEYHESAANLRIYFYASLSFKGRK